MQLQPQTFHLRQVIRSVLNFARWQILGSERNEKSLLDSSVSAQRSSPNYIKFIHLYICYSTLNSLQEVRNILMYSYTRQSNNLAERLCWMQGINYRCAGMILIVSILFIPVESFPFPLPPIPGARPQPYSHFPTPLSLTSHFHYQHAITVFKILESQEMCILSCIRNKNYRAAPFIVILHHYYFQSVSCQQILFNVHLSLHVAMQKNHVSVTFSVDINGIF